MEIVIGIVLYLVLALGLAVFLGKCIAAGGEE